MTRLGFLIEQIKYAMEAELPKEIIKQDGPTFFDESSISKKHQVLQAVLKRAKPITEDDLSWVESDLTAFFEKNMNEDYLTELKSEKYYRFLDLRDDPTSRIVVVGDVHCDFYALAALLLKLSASTYDYFESGHIVFLGDYLDRGGCVFEHLLLLMDLKQILGDRMIMLKGNHEMVSFNEKTQELESRVIPQDTCPVLNEYCGSNKDFLKSFGDFFRTLPTYVYLKVADQIVLLTHAAVPRQMFIDNFKYDQLTGAIVFEPHYLYEQQKAACTTTSDNSMTTMNTTFSNNVLKVRNRILNDMIWGDPSKDKEKYQVSGRFQFGSLQFDAYAQKNQLSRLFRSHEPVSDGYEAFFDNRLYTIFSTGGSQNDQAGYGDINPAFAVIKGDGSYFVENSFVYKMELSGVLDLVCNLFSGEIIQGNDAKHCSLNEEFYCSENEALKIETMFAYIKQGFNVPEEETENDEEQTSQETQTEEEVVTSEDETGDLKNEELSEQPKSE